MPTHQALLSKKGDTMKQSLDLFSPGPTKIPSINIPKEVGHGGWEVFSGSDTSLFSSSLPVFPHEKLNLNGTVNGLQSIDDISSGFNMPHHDVVGNGSFGDVNARAVRTVLPDDEELLPGIMDDLT